MSVADTSEYEGAFGALVRQARRQGGSRGFEGVFTNPSFGCQMILYTSYLSGPLPSLPLRITAVQTSLFAAMHTTEHTRKQFTLLRGKDAHKYARKFVNCYLGARELFTHDIAHLPVTPVQPMRSGIG